uniref:Uncharacterized protein n=1 Tax=Palpitomonas bilix TaxID=652834 RepID=A0A7S3G8I4_9EUKA
MSGMEESKEEFEHILDDMIVKSAEQYVQKAVRLATDTPRRLYLRRALLRLSHTSSLLDGQAKAKSVEGGVKMAVDLFHSVQHISSPRGCESSLRCIQCRE